MYKKIEDNNNLVRDMTSNAVINFDNHGFKSYINTRERLSNQHEKISGLETQVSILNDELVKIKQLLGNLIN
jgi:hypothetical protein